MQWRSCTISCGSAVWIPCWMQTPPCRQRWQCTARAQGGGVAGRRGERVPFALSGSTHLRSPFDVLESPCDALDAYGGLRCPWAPLMPIRCRQAASEQSNTQLEHVITHSRQLSHFQVSSPDVIVVSLLHLCLVPSLSACGPICLCASCLLAWSPPLLPPVQSGPVSPPM